MTVEWNAPPQHRRAFSASKILDLGQHRRQDEARRLRDLLTRFVVPSLDSDRRMPTDEQIARQFHSSRNAARIALQMLADERIIERQVGVGTYAHGDPYVWRSDRLVDSLVAAKSGAARGMRLIGWRIGAEIPEPMRTQFPTSTDQMVIFEKVLLYGGHAGSLRTYYVPLRPGDEFSPEDAAADIFDILERRFQHSPLKADRRISAVAADASAAELLNTTVGEPLLFIETLVRNEAGAVVLSYYGRQRTDLVQVSLEPGRFTYE